MIWLKGLWQPLFLPFHNSAEGWTFSLVSLDKGLFNDDKFRSPVGSLLASSWTIRVPPRKQWCWPEAEMLTRPFTCSPQALLTSDSTAGSFLATSLTPGHLCFRLQNNFAYQSPLPCKPWVIMTRIPKGFPACLCGLRWPDEKAELGLPLSQQPGWNCVRTEVFQAKNTSPAFQNSSHKAFHTHLLCHDSPGMKYTLL